MEQQVLAWIAQYGYLAIFSLLVLGIVGLPVPDETLLTFTGYLVFQGHLSLPLAFLSGFAGSACGITLSYILGRTFGLKLIHRYGISASAKKISTKPRRRPGQGRPGGPKRWALGGSLPATSLAPVAPSGGRAGPGRHPSPPLFSPLPLGRGVVLWASTFIAAGYLAWRKWFRTPRK